MSTIVKGMCRLISLGYDTADVVKYAQDTWQPETRTIEGTVGLAARVVGLGAAGCELGGQAIGWSSSTLRTIKKVELGAKVLQTYVGLCESDLGAHLDSVGSLARYVERRILAPLASIDRLTNEYETYSAKTQLDLSLVARVSDSRCELAVIEEGDNTRRAKQAGRAESRTALAHLAAERPSLLQTEVFHKTGAGALVVGNVYRYTIRQAQAMLPPHILAQFNIGAPQIALPQVPAQPALDPFDFVAHRDIPAVLQNNPVFANLVCPISLMPIRRPVRDPNGITIYERAAILRSIQANPRSPMTRLPLTANMLQPLPALRAYIDASLAGYQAAVQQVLAAPLPPDPLLDQQRNNARNEIGNQQIV